LAGPSIIGIRDKLELLEGGVCEGEVYRGADRADFEGGRGQDVGARRVPQAQRHEAAVYRWKAKYGGMDVSEVKCLQVLERENEELKKIVAEQALDIRILKDVNSNIF